ncbi:MAG: PAS domain S-box protein, partial [Bacteroidales bacterium]
MDYNKFSKEELIGYLKNLDEKFQSLETYLKNEIQELVTQNHILKEESFKISRLINNITDTIWELDDKLNFIFVNFASKNLTGYLPEELTGKSLFNFLHEDDIVPLKEKYEERVKKFFETRQITEHIFDFRLKNKKGHYNWVEVLSNPIVDEKGRLKGFRGVCRDISQWKEANEKLILSEQKLFKIFNSIPLAIIVFRIKDKKLIDLNKAAEEFTGYTKDELIAENPLVYNIWDNLEDRNKYLESIKNSQKLDQLKIGFRNRTGNIGTALISTDFIVFENEPCSIVYFEVITEKIKTERMLEESREKYKELGEAVFDSIFILEGNKFVEQNSLAKKVFGYSFEEIEGKEFTELFVSDKREMIRQCMKSGISNPLHVNALKKNGSVFPALIRARLMQYFDKSVWAVSVSDLSQQRIIEEKLIESEKQFRLIFEKTNDAIFWAEASSGILIRCNKAAEQLVERTEQELIGQHHSILHPNEKLDDSSKQFREHVQNKGIQALESIVITKSGILKTVEVTSTIINIDGKIINQGVFKDITQKMKLAEALKSLVMPWTKSDLPGVFAFIVQNLLKVVQVKYGFIGQIT